MLPTRTSCAKSPAMVPGHEPNRPFQYSTARLSTANPAQYFVHCSYFTICFPCLDTPLGQGWVAGGARSARIRLQTPRSEEHTSEIQSRQYPVCRLLPEKKRVKSIIFIARQRRHSCTLQLVLDLVA